MDPNPSPPPLILEMQQLRDSFCKWFALRCEVFSRHWHGVPSFRLDFSNPEENDINKGLSGYALIESQGYRQHMEDRFVASQICENKFGFFAVLDGHGFENEGHLISDYASKNLAQMCDDFISQSVFAGLKMEFNKVDDEGNVYNNVNNLEKIRDSLDLAFTHLDLKMRRLLPVASENNGSTVTSVLVNSENLVFANLGDSRAILINNDYSLEFVTLDHKPMVASEEQRIQQAGGYINDLRVNGDLAVSRSLGDANYKGSSDSLPRSQCPISNEPDITVMPREAKHRAVLLATDGLWDAMSSTELVDIFKKYALFDNDIYSHSVPDGPNSFKSRYAAVTKILLKEIMCRRLSSDNITILLVMLRDPLR